ncbi:MAG: YgiQ family radical SAM protein, partial [Oligoflexia bacterium]|nr:YgiQ family radical SAM protein [Oligoflexia bacterium]
MRNTIDTIVTGDTILSRPVMLPTTQVELKQLGWKQLDVVLVSGDTYIDSPYMGVAVIGRWLSYHGFRVGIIAQPNDSLDDGLEDIGRLGEPRLFWGVSAGAMDSMVANYTPLLKRRRSDDLTPGGVNDRRPDRACIVYSNLIRRKFKNTVPIVLGGVEASLRRIAHYDYWSNRLRRSLLLDAKADILIYGQGELAVLELARSLASAPLGAWVLAKIPGICYLAKDVNAKFEELPSYQQIQGLDGRQAFENMFEIFYKRWPYQGLYQKYDNRYLIHNPPARSLTSDELDLIHELPYTRDTHPHYASAGKVVANDTIKFSVTTHRGCYGECNFCAIAVHQGRKIISRSKESILREIGHLATHVDFKG